LKYKCIITRECELISFDGVVLRFVAVGGNVV
jgi:hypothetical protein